MTAHNLPSQPTPFVGREEELSQLLERINNRDCRLLTLMGLGGSGKTRLVIEVANRVEKSLVENIYFVALQPITLIQNLPLAIADAIGLVMRGQGEPTQQILNYLQDKNCLLILDNLEHLLPSTDFLGEILNVAPAVKLLVTSREALNLREEWLFTVQGMEVPSGDKARPTETYDSIRLFEVYAQRIRPDFSLKTDQNHVVRICQLVEGLPLAIELLASWLRYMSCAQIADEVTQGVDFLHTNLRNLPARHQSLRAVFDQSWKLLSDQEQNICKRLAVFRGHFSRDAAAQVAEANLTTLSALVDKSIFHRDAEGRYWMHELLRQHAESYLRENDGDFQAAQEQLGNYYAHYLHTRMDGSMGHYQIEIAQEIAVELDNIRAAWQWAVEENNPRFFEKAGQALHLFYQFTSRYTEGADMLYQAIRALNDNQSTDTSRVLLALQTNLGWMYIRLGKLVEAEQVLLQNIDQYHHLGIPPLYGHGTDPRLPLGILSVIRGDYHRAQHYGEDAYRIAETHHHIWNMAFANYVLASAALAVGALDKAAHCANEACRLAEQVGDRWSMAYFLNECGNVALTREDYSAANRYYRDSYGLREAFNDPQGMAVALNHLGEVALLQNDTEMARDYYRQSRVIYETIHDYGGLAEALTGLGTVASTLGDYTQAAQHFQNALQIAQEIHYQKLIFSILNNVAAMWLKAGKAERGGELLAVVQHHPGSDFEAKTRANYLLQAHNTNASTPPDIPNDISKLIGVVREALAQSTAQQAIRLPNQQLLVEPLTEREFDVLRLLSLGMTNEEIAKELTLAVGTIKAHNNRIFGKLAVTNRTQAVARARELNLL
jgi:predicted ATPase/DNA-binding CsgD family transcriptional regulator